MTCQCRCHYDPHIDRHFNACCSNTNELHEGADIDQTRLTKYIQDLVDLEQRFKELPYYWNDYLESLTVMRSKLT